MTQLDDVRDWVGTGTDTEVIAAALARFADADHTVERAALSILLRRQADAGPAKWSVDGDYSEDGTSGERWLVAQIGRLRAIVGDTVSALPPLTSTALLGPGNLR